MTLTNFDHDPLLDGGSWQGQIVQGFTFDRVDGATGMSLGRVHPIRAGSLSHDTSRVVMRQVSLQFGVEDQAAIDPLTDRIDITMILSDGRSFPLGRFMFNDMSAQVFTSGDLGSATLVDELFIVDQDMEAGYSAVNRNCGLAIADLLARSGISIDLLIEPTNILSTLSWSIGSSRGQAVQALALAGDYFSPWIGSDRKIHCIRSFDPATAIPDFDWDSNKRVIRSNISRRTDALTAPNRFIVVSNSSSDPTAASVGVADVPANAPYSIPKRGFVIPKVVALQAPDFGAVSAIAQNLVRRQTVFEVATLSTVPDPRHEAFNVVRWDGSNWLETSWSLSLSPGGMMTHTLRKAYLA